MIAQQNGFKDSTKKAYLSKMPQKLFTAISETYLGVADTFLRGSIHPLLLRAVEDYERASTLSDGKTPRKSIGLGRQTRSNYDTHDAVTFEKKLKKAA